MKWNDLTMKERSDLMSLFLKHGIGSLSDMKRIYDGNQNTDIGVDSPEDDNWLVRARKNVTDYLGLTHHYDEYKKSQRVAEEVVRRNNPYNGTVYKKLPTGHVVPSEQPLIPMEYELMGYTPVGDVQTFALEVPEAYKQGGVEAALKMAGLGLIGFVPGVGDAVSKAGKKYAVRHGVPKKVIEQNIERGTMSTVAPSIALTNPERLFGFGYAGRDGVTFLGDNTLLKNAELYLGDAQTPTIQRVMNHYKLPDDIPQEELLEYVKRYADEVYRADQPIATEEAIRKGISGVYPYNEAKVYEAVPYNKFKAAITDHRNTDIIKTLSDEGLEVIPIYPENYPMNRELSEMVNWEANNFYYDHPEYLFSEGGRLYSEETNTHYEEKLKKKSKRFA